MFPTRSSPGASTSTCGACCRRLTRSNRSSATERQASAKRSWPRCSPTIGKYAEHWISFWNDLLRNEDGVTYFSESASRKSITDWLLASLESNLPYDQFVTKLLNPSAPTDPEGFLVGVNWRGETSAAVTPWMQASQNSAQVFLGINLKCNACHDSFVSKWKLKDAYSLAAYFSPDPGFRCSAATSRRIASRSQAFCFPSWAAFQHRTRSRDRRAAAAETFTDPRNGRLPRTLVNRIWQRLFGHGIVANPDEMDGQPWSPELLDWLASDFVEHGYDMKRLIADDPDVACVPDAGRREKAEPPARGYAFAGPEVRRLTAEQFADAVGAITGEWNVYHRPPPRHQMPSPAGQAGAAASGFAEHLPLRRRPTEHVRHLQGGPRASGVSRRPI